MSGGDGVVAVPGVRPLQDAMEEIPAGRWLGHPGSDYTAWWKTLPEGWKRK